jgi:NTE family protein
VFEFLSKRARNGEGATALDEAAAHAEPEAGVPAVIAAAGASPTGDVAMGTVEPAARAATGATRPSIGFALGGGAARGFAHIGFVRTLVANGIKPDVIAGTSIGALVGGCYAAGHLDSLEEWARTLTRRRVFGYLDFSLAGSGLIGGSRLAERLKMTLGTTTFDQLPIQFAAIATEIGTGHEIWLTRGRLAEALHASYALPGIFSPVQIGGRWLMDGALVNPVPVSAARALGARVVIGVNLNADLVGRGTTISNFGADASDDAVIEATAPPRGLRAMFGVERILKRQFIGTPSRPGFSTVMMEAFNIMQDRITRARLAGDPADMMISPRLGRIGLIDFDHAAEAIAIGAEAAERALEPIGEVIAALG